VSAPIIADRYGRRRSPTRSRRSLLAVLAVFVLAGVGFATWIAVDRSRSALTWIELGVDVAGDDAATLTFQISLPPGREAVCTVRVVNDVRTEVGRRDVVVGPSATGVVRTAVTMRTTERASAGNVRDCVLR
jgi:hypothetical protein